LTSRHAPPNLESFKQPLRFNPVQISSFLSQLIPPTRWDILKPFSVNCFATHRTCHERFMQAHGEILEITEQIGSRSARGF
jgi:hypothetical protein